MSERRLRVTHCPVNIAGIPWENVQALKRKGIDARLVVFERGKLHHEADWSLDRHGPLLRKLAEEAPSRRLARASHVLHPPGRPESFQAPTSRSL